MVELDESVIDEARSRSETLTIRELVRLAETYHPDDRPGVDRNLLDAYLDELGYDVAEYGVEVDGRLTDSSGWSDEDALYDLGDGRLSAFPSAWHDELAGSTDLTEYVRVIQSDVDETEGLEEEAISEAGVSEQLLLRAMGAIGRVGREEAREQLTDLRRRGVVEESADQHPSGTVRLT